MITVEHIRARVCMAKLESAVFDKSCNQLLQKELAVNLKDMGAVEQAEAVRVMGDLSVYCSQISMLIGMLEATLGKSETGRGMLDDFHERM